MGSLMLDDMHRRQGIDESGIQLIHEWEQGLRKHVIVQNAEGVTVFEGISVGSLDPEHPTYDGGA